MCMYTSKDMYLILCAHNVFLICYTRMIHCSIVAICWYETYVYICFCIRTHVHKVRVYTCMYTSTHVYLCEHVCIYMHLCHSYIYIYIYICIHMHMYMCVNVCIHKQTYLHIYIYITCISI